MPSFWFDRHLEPSQFDQQRKSRIVLMQDATCHTHYVELGPDSLRPPLRMKRAPTSRPVRALDLCSTSRFSRSFYGDGAASQIGNSDRGFGRTGRPRHVPQLRERLLRAAGQSSGPARSNHRHWPCRDDFGRRVRPGERGLGQRPYARRPIQSLVPQGNGADDGRGYREISRLRHDPGHRPDICEEARARLR
jgi:hypothetical protein